MALTSSFSPSFSLNLVQKPLESFKARKPSSLRVTCKSPSHDKLWSVKHQNTNNEFKSFDESKTGVKGLADSGLKKLPTFFIHEYLKTQKKSTSNTKKGKVPVIDIDFDGASGNLDKRGEIIGEIRDACENMGVFQIVNHGIPQHVMDEVIKGIVDFHEQDTEIKKKFYTRDNSKRVIYNSNLFTYNTSPAVWKDSLLCKMSPLEPHWDELPEICRDSLNEYANHVSTLGRTLMELLSEALGLDKDYLSNLGCFEGLYMKGHYSPPCPEPELTLSTVEHSDSGFLTLLLQNDVDALQVAHNGEYVDVPYVPGALVINIGDILQAITNNRFKSIHHRALARDVGRPRINLATFVRPNQGAEYASRKWEPIKELLSADNPPVYRPFTIAEYLACYIENGVNGRISLPLFYKSESDCLEKV